ncbi:MAG TPA: hypothetical protein PKV16_08910 [Caldisericia bacterium]|nr:hypothetical protein [Caldisericia bacterium]HPF49567.1 hypothetical protein [Caldisericia bacterium]HPI84517.1 hypothetical protein [Caldisericia bacterium]HPQ93883.1 hypothetical protein [Caldisericia bacterium]HRV75428.1 hypothetical protein [Caldisericia bacterium]
MNRCKSCGRVIKGDANAEYCSNCLDENGNVKDYNDVTKDLSKYLTETQGLDESAAINAAKAIASSQPHWKRKQGVYFESDMKKKRRVIVSLVVIIALFVSGTGFGLWWLTRDEPILKPLFADDENYLITRTVGDVTVNELNIDGHQRSPKQFFDDNPDVITFIDSDPYRYWNKVGYGYNIVENFGMQINPPSEEKTKKSTFTRDGLYMIATLDGDDENEHTDLRINFYSNDFFTRDRGDKPICNLGTAYYSGLIQQGEYTSSNNWWKEVYCGVYDPVLHADYISWTEKAYDSWYAPKSRVLYNPHIDKTTIISDSIYKDQYFTSDSLFVWMDNREIDQKYPFVYGYDINNNEEFLISDMFGDGILELNNRYVLLSNAYDKEGVWNISPRIGIQIYDTQTKKILSKDLIRRPLFQFFNENVEFYETMKDDFLFPDVSISDNITPEETYVSWVEFVDERVQLADGWNKELIEQWDFEPDIHINQIAVQNIANAGKEPLRVRGGSDRVERQAPVAITSEYILWQSIDFQTGTVKLWLGAIENGEDDGIIESVLLDESQIKHWYGLDEIYTDASITDKYVFWVKENQWEEDKSNICWVELSEIFGE